MLINTAVTVSASQKAENTVEAKQNSKERKPKLTVGWAPLLK